MNYTIDNKTIRDEYGRERIFKGINYCIKDPKRSQRIIKRELNDLVSAVDSHGINIVRLGISWECIQPSENKFNDDKIRILHDFVKSLEGKDVAVLLDMHQDLFSRHGIHGDGAPKWAIDSEIKRQSPMLVWAEGYFYMDSVQQEFFDFWTNKNGIQEKYVHAWQYYAKQFDDCKNIIGYDFFNEPYPHKNGRNMFFSMLEYLIEHSLGARLDLKGNFANRKDKNGFIKSVLDIARTVKTPNRLKAVLNDFDSYDTFKLVQKDFDETIEEFNAKYYQPFFDKMKNALPNKTAFFEHSYYCNMGVPFEINAGDDTVYSPHAYDVFIDTPMYNKSSTDRIRYILDSIKQNQDKMNTPIIFGEWGGGCKRGTGWIKHIDYVYNQMEKHKWSNIYWSYNFENHKFTKIMNRPYPVAICGDIVEYHSDSETRTFEIKWVQDKEYPAPSIIYTPNGVQKINGKIGENHIKLSY